MNDIMNLFSLNGKNAVVTGANTGLGQGICVALAAAGAHVFGVAAAAATRPPPRSPLRAASLPRSAPTFRTLPPSILFLSRSTPTPTASTFWSTTPVSQQVRRIDVTPETGTPWIS